jgi:hypothetical protein
VWSAQLDLRSRERHPLARAEAVPQGSVRAPSQALFKAAARLELAVLREDAWQTALVIADALADHADWDTMLSRPTHAELARVAGCSTRTVARVRARLEAAGLIGIVTPGRTSDPVAPQDGPLAQAYILTIPQHLLARLQPTSEPDDQGEDAPAQPDREPGDQDDVAGDEQAQAPGQDGLTRADDPVDETVTPSKSTFGGLGKDQPPHARDAQAGAREVPAWARSARGASSNTGRPALDEGGLGREIIWPTTVRPATRTERHLAAAEAHRIDPVLRRVSVAHVAALAREWHLAGWTIADFRWALVYRPDGTPWPHSLVAADVRHVPGWVRHRLAAWRTDPADLASPPTRSRSQRIQAARAAEAAAHAAAAAEHAATAAAALAPDQVDGWTGHRARLAERTAAAAAVRRAQAQQATTEAAAAGPAPAVRPAPAVVDRPQPRPGAVRPVDETADPRIAALRAATRAARRR